MNGVKKIQFKSYLLPSSVIFFIGKCFYKSEKLAADNILFKFCGCIKTALVKKWRRRKAPKRPSYWLHNAVGAYDEGFVNDVSRVLRVRKDYLNSDTNFIKYSYFSDLKIVSATAILFCPSGATRFQLDFSGDSNEYHTSGGNHPTRPGKSRWTHLPLHAYSIVAVCDCSTFAALP